MVKVSLIEYCLLALRDAPITTVTRMPCWTFGSVLLLSYLEATSKEGPWFKFVFFFLFASSELLYPLFARLFLLVFRRTWVMRPFIRWSLGSFICLFLPSSSVYLVYLSLLVIRLFSHLPICLLPWLSLCFFVRFFVLLYVRLSLFICVFSFCLFTHFG